jgi:single-strand DNA-binding protein
MSSLNKVFLVGRLGSDPEVRYTADQKAIANFSMATSTYSSSGGEKKEYTEWHRCVAFNKAADVVSNYLKKGSLVLVEGSLRTNKWEDKEGNKRSQVEVVVGRLTMLGSRHDSAQDGSTDSGNTSARPATQEPPVGDFDGLDGEYPF